MKYLSAKFNIDDFEKSKNIVIECGGLLYLDGVPELKLVYFTANTDEELIEICKKLREKTEVVRIADYSRLKSNLRSDFLPNFNNPLQDHVYWAKRMDFYTAWKYTTGNPNIKIGVIDTGLMPKIFEPYGGCIYPDFAWSTVTQSSSPIESAENEVSISHGSLVWSTIKHRHNSSKGFSGACPDCWGLFISISDGAVTDGSGYIDIPGAIVMATNQGIRVLNCSWGFYSDEDEFGNPTGLYYGNYSPVLDINEAIEYAMANGVIIINAAGNYREHWQRTPRKSPDDPRWCTPSEIEGVILVGSAGGPEPHKYDTPWGGDEGLGVDDFHAAPAYGTAIDLIGPGRNIFLEQNEYKSNITGYSLLGNGPNYSAGFEPDTFLILNGQQLSYSINYKHKHATSYLGPIVAGAFALVLSINPELTKDEVLNIFHATGSKTYHIDIKTRYPEASMVNAGHAILKTLTTLPENNGIIYPYLNPYPCTAIHYDQNTNSSYINLGETQQLLVTAECSDPIETIELWIGGIKKYDGPPSLIEISATYDGFNKSEVKIIAKSSNAIKEEIFDDILVTNLDVVQIAQAETFPENSIDIWKKEWEAYDSLDVNIKTKIYSKPFHPIGFPPKRNNSFTSSTPGAKFQISSDNGNTWGAELTTTSTLNRNSLIRLILPSNLAPQSLEEEVKVYFNSSSLSTYTGSWRIKAKGLPPITNYIRSFSGPKNIELKKTNGENKGIVKRKTGASWS